MGFGDRLIEVVLVVLGVAVAGLIILLVAGVLYQAADSWSQPLEQGYGLIVGKDFVPAHTTTSLILVGKIFVPVTNYHPDNWEVSVGVDDQQDSISVTEEFYESVSNGDRVKVEFVHGRYSGDLYLKDIRLAN